MLPSETDSQSAGFNLLPHATVRGVRIELTHTGIQNRRPTLDHPPVVSSLECGSNAPLRVFSAALSPGQLSRARACRHAGVGLRAQCCDCDRLSKSSDFERWKHDNFRGPFGGERRRADLGSRTQLAGVRNRSDHHDHLIGRAVGVGIEPTESALTVRSVYQHTSPTRWVANPGKWDPRPPYTGDRRAHECAPSRRFELSESRRHTSAFGALVGNRTLSGGLRTRCSTNELQAQIHV